MGTAKRQVIRGAFMAKSSQSSARQIPAHETSTATPWIYNPWLDLIVGCGAWSTPLLLLSYFSIASHARAWAVAFYALALFFNYPHYMATLYRAYHSAEDFQKYRIFTVHITALILLTLLLSHFWFRALPWIFTVYLTWSPWHYSGQNYGLFMMFARRAGAKPAAAVRRALYGAFIASYLILFLGFHTGPSSDPLFVSLGIPAIVSRWEQIVLVAAFVLLSAFGLSRLAKETGWRKLAPSLTLFSSQFLWFLFPAAISLFKGLEIPQSRYSSGVLAVMHSAQYIWITSYYARREGSTESGRNWRPLAYFGVLVTGGIALFVPGPWLASRVFHYDFTASFLIFTALVNIHHFILDGALWKLRDGRIAALLLHSRDRVADAAAGVGGRITASRRWLTGDTSSARTLRVSAAVALLVWGSVDQVRYYLALHADNLQDLKRAASLDAVDSSLQMRLARREIESGQSQEAEAALRKAVQANQSDPLPRQALLRYLLAQKRFDEAYALTDTILQYTPKDADLLIDRGILARQLGKKDQAVSSWDKALAIDPNKFQAHLYLADEFDHEGNPQAAIPHYAMFLETIAHQGAQARPEPGNLITIVLKMAECQVRASQGDQAAKSYHLAGQIAGQTHETRLESVADVNEAELQANAGKRDAAMQLYQHALQLDDSLNDPHSLAEDWFSYGRFLEDAGYPALAYASIVKSEGLTRSVSAPDAALPQAVTETKKQLEKQLGNKASAIRRDLGPVLQQARLLRH
jgi:tetratricopeptide (TPR) repeat protein